MGSLLFDVAIMKFDVGTRNPANGDGGTLKAQ
jgi:hypothetical protein